MNNDPYIRHPSTVNTIKNVECVNKMIVSNHCIKIKETASELNITYSSACMAIHYQLGYYKLCTQWMPHNNHKYQHFAAIWSFFSVIPWMVHSFYRDSSWKMRAGCTITFQRQIKHQMSGNTRICHSQNNSNIRLCWRSFWIWRSHL